VIAEGRPLDMLDAEQIADADHTQLNTDDRYDEPADCRRKKGAEPTQ